jgi:hypothetical protein
MASGLENHSQFHLELKCVGSQFVCLRFSILVTCIYCFHLNETVGHPPLTAKKMTSGLCFSNAQVIPSPSSA